MRAPSPRARGIAMVGSVGFAMVLALLAGWALATYHAGVAALLLSTAVMWAVLGVLRLLSRRAAPDLAARIDRVPRLLGLGALMSFVLLLLFLTATAIYGPAAGLIELAVYSGLAIIVLLLATARLRKI